ncbi:hypothetical protein SOJ16_000141 [Caldicellulosiruptor danielii]|uniref:Uncharacterized protein n=1 Tax=Anaerocellum danielii TaxID=1387557 RepID=A0ABZ0U0G7_9FIRM|nr:hypothetical protein [Caldicellulosiruptor danielii]WPX08974.1 hypothetical protein SOJ16_000141 [Caldicellulosiruptor danielii]
MGVLLEVAGVLISIYVLLKLIGLRVIPNDKVGIVEKWWSFKGSLDEQIIALHGEAGFQPEVLRGGIHFRTSLMCKVHIVPLVTIQQGQIGYVFARDGKPLEATQTLGKVIPECNNFRDVRLFWKTVVREVRKEAFCVKVLMLLTLRSSLSSQKTRFIIFQWAAKKKKKC